MSNSPKLIAMSGLPGVGKSTLAEKIAIELMIPIFSIDPIESAIIKAGIAKSFETGYAAYLVAEKLAEEQIKLGNSVVIDAANVEKEGQQIWLTCAKRLEMPLIVINCVFKDESKHRSRLEARVRNLHGFDEVTWEQVVERRKVHAPWKIDVITLEMNDDPSINLRSALDFIARHNSRTPQWLQCRDHPSAHTKP